MAIYEHQCQNPECGYEWEDEYSIKQDPPTQCPKCLQETAKRMISLGGKGVVELTGQDLVDKCKADAKQMKKDIAKDANKYANFLGEAKYHELQTKMDRRKR
jgi:putative FmdB family regulatory protein